MRESFSVEIALIFFIFISIVFSAPAIIKHLGKQEECKSFCKEIGWQDSIYDQDKMTCHCENQIESEVGYRDN